MNPLKFGDVTVSKVVELDRSATPIGFMLPDSTPERVAAQRDWLGADLLDPATGNHRSTIHSYIVETPWHTIVIDTCVGNDKQRHGQEPWHMRKGSYIADLSATGLKVEDVDLVVCTHLHVDHVGWNTRFEDGCWVPTFPNARYIFARDEFEFWKKESDEGREEYPLIADSVLPIVDAGRAELVPSDYVIDDRLQFEPSPGHTPGHVNVRLRTKAGEAVFTGDMMHRAIQVAEPGWNSRFCNDGPLAVKTRRAFIEKHADADVTILAAHFPVPGRIVAPGGKTRFRPLAS